MKTKEFRNGREVALATRDKALALHGKNGTIISPGMEKYYGYETMLRHVLTNGQPKTDRTGTGTIGVHGYQERFDLKNGFPLITTKKVKFDLILHELLWLVRGETNIKYLVENNVSIWSDWPLKYYNQKRREDAQFHASVSGADIAEHEADAIQDISMQEFHEKILHEPGFAEQWGELGPVYGKQWRAWETPKTKLVPAVSGPGQNVIVTIDQLQVAIDQLKRENETGIMNRRVIVVAWNPADIEEMAKSGLPPCHCFFQFHTVLMSLEERQEYFAELLGKHISYTQDMDDDALDAAGAPALKLDLQLYQRSCDIFLGVPFNIASYSLLLMMVAQVVNMKPGTFIHDYGDLHIYLNHLDQVVEQLSKEPFAYPTMKIANRNQSIDGFSVGDFELVNYQSHKYIKADVAV